MWPDPYKISSDDQKTRPMAQAREENKLQTRIQAVVC